LFFDYNGNGVQDGGEPAVAGALVQLNDNVGNVIAETLTDSSGDYRLEDVRTGSYNLHVEAEKKFRYICTLPDEFRAVSDTYTIPLQGTTSFNIGLMEGFLTLPLRRGTRFHYNAYFDDDPSNSMKDWKGGGNTANNHEGTDFGVPIGTPVFSAAPGIVKYVDDWGPVGIFVIVSHDPYARNTSTLYAHLSKSLVEEGQSIQRGARIGESGEVKTAPGPHLHFELDFGFHGSPTRGSQYQPVDPFRAIWNPTAIGYWTKDNTPQYAVM
jgi:murein DD-endopeptidase MepM/ murein hydrolase activator NlpD